MSFLRGAWRFLVGVKDALALRQEAVLTVERLLAGPHTRAELARARRRVEALAAASVTLLAEFEHAAGLRPAGPPLSEATARS